MGFNAINFIVNTVSILSAAQAKEQSAGSNLVQNQTQTAQSSVSGGSASSYTASSSSTYSALSTTGQTIISTVEVENQANYIKDLLSLPRDFQTLIDQIQNSDPSLQALKELSKLLSNGKINLNALSALLGNNSKAASQKLMMTIMTVSKMGSNNVGQLKELMGMLQSASSSIDSTQAVKNLLMLYLPWLPLSVRNSLNLDLEIGIFDKIQNEGGSESDEIIKILIQTAHYGNIMATLELTPEGDIDVFISAIESFPEREVLSALNKETNKTNIKTNVKIEKNKDPETSEHFKQNIQITSSDYVSPKLILAAHSLIKIIIDVDLKENIINEENEN
ncbi:MAG: hypothetical protein LUE64_04910 [Candidatus Gastranaerophilales bacterium]|nr:hypothetical protein [Candidatus Gastranaerophilales bacterium]